MNDVLFVAVPYASTPDHVALVHAIEQETGGVIETTIQTLKERFGLVITDAQVRDNPALFQHYMNKPDSGMDEVLRSLAPRRLLYARDLALRLQIRYLESLHETHGKPVPVACPDCKGSGQRRGKECPVCEGHGTILHTANPHPKDIRELAQSVELATRTNSAAAESGSSRRLADAIGNAALNKVLEVTEAIFSRIRRIEAELGRTEEGDILPEYTTVEIPSESEKVENRPVGK